MWVNAADVCAECCTRVQSVSVDDFVAGSHLERWQRERPIGGERCRPRSVKDLLLLVLDVLQAARQHWHHTLVLRTNTPTLRHGHDRHLSTHLPDGFVGRRGLQDERTGACRPKRADPCACIQT